MSIEFVGCHNARDMKTIEEIECPNCHVKDGIEVFVKDGHIIADGECEECGYVIPEGTSVMELGTNI